MQASGAIKTNHEYWKDQIALQRLDQVDNELIDLVKQGQADDLFAFGCIMWELLHPSRALPWGLMARYAANGRYFIGVRAAVLQVQMYHHLIEEISRTGNQKKKALLLLTSDLLHPEPAKAKMEFNVRVYYAN